MKKSLLALLLCLSLCLPVLLTACGDNKEEENKTTITNTSNSSSKTVTIYSITDDSTTAEQIAVVEQAFNNITKSKYNTKVVLKLYTEKEYDNAVKKALESNREAFENEEKASVTIDENGYPNATENQLDIFLVRSFKEYRELVEAEDLSPIDEELAQSANLLNSYVYPTMLRASKVEGEQYGVFNNTVFGGYEYILLNKELVDKYDYDPEELNGIENIARFLKEVKDKEPGYIPFLGEYTVPAFYMTENESLYGVLAESLLNGTGTIDATKHVPLGTSSSPLAPRNLLNTQAYKTWMEKYNELYQKGCLVEKTDDNSNSSFAATIIEGDVTLSPTYKSVYGNYKRDEFGFDYITYEDGKDYYVKMHKRPTATNENVFAAGYVVSAYTQDVSSCMNIIMGLNTDPALANIFQYGVQDVHYTLDISTGMVKPIANSGYSMNMKYSGNMYLLKQSTTMDEYWRFMSDDSWHNAKNTNRDTVFSPFLGFYYNPEKPEDSDQDDENAEEQPMIKTELTYEAALKQVADKTPAIIEELKTFKNVDPATGNAATFKDFLAIELQKSLQIEGLKVITETNAPYYGVMTYREWLTNHYNVNLS